MTDKEMRGLDAWLAEHGCIQAYCKVLGYVPSFTTNPRKFAAAQREIERRVWKWGGESHPEGWYWFRIWKEEETEDPLQMKVTVLGQGYERSEELAGCLALKAAVEAADG